MSRRDGCGAAVIAALLSVPLLGQPASACAVPTSIRVENRTGQAVREVFVSGPERGANQLVTVLAPGGAATIVLPSCLGTYEISAVVADGRVARFPRLNATTIRGLELR